MERIGEYLVKRLVGEGGMGKVYEAEERLTQRKVALKVLRPELTRTDEGRRLFLNEMQILAHLEHPNIVRSLASMEEDGQLVMVLEFLEGRTLRDELVSRGKLSWQEALEIVASMAEALVVAHGQQPPIIHRDLKPENVMLMTSGTSAGGRSKGAGLKVMDFGIAKMLQAAHATNTQSIGTLQYMSPEQIDAQTIDTRSDLYSLGLIFYECLAGEPPFRSASPRELLNMQCSTEPPELSEDARVGLPRGVEALLFDLLEKAPGARPATASVVVERLAPFRSAGGPSPRVTRPGAKATAASASDGHAGGSARGDARSGDTGRSVVSSRTPTAAVRDSDNEDEKAKEPRRPGSLDTIALVEKATEGRQVPTSIALLAILALSVVAGIATYTIRMHTGASVDAPGTATATANVAPGVGDGTRGPAR